MKAAYEVASADMIRLFYKGFTDDEIDDFENYLKRIYSNLSG